MNTDRILDSEFIFNEESLAFHIHVHVKSGQLTVNINVGGISVFQYWIL